MTKKNFIGSLLRRHDNHEEKPHHTPNLPHQEPVHETKHQKLEAHSKKEKRIDEKLAEMREKELSLKGQIHKDMETIKVMDNIVRERHENLEVHERRLIELKKEYELKLTKLKEKEAQIIANEQAVEKKRKDVLNQITNLGSDVQKLHSEKQSLLSDISKAKYAREESEKKLIEVQKKLSDKEKHAHELTREVDRKVDDMMRRQKHFEELFRATKLLEEKNKKDGERLAHVATQIKTHESKLTEVHGKLKHYSGMHEKFASEIDKSKLAEINTLVQAINSNLAKGNVESAKIHYDKIRMVYKELGEKSKVKVYHDIIKMQEKIYALVEKKPLSSSIKVF